ncbi:MAG: DNA repair protein RecO [Bacteroidales bacterium]|jgi:DNA repair protein RecO (recombination protein O)
MITPLQFIVLNAKPYRETSLLVSGYADVKGRMDFVVNGVRTAKNKAAAAVFHPLSLLDAQAYVSQKHTLHRLKEYKKALPLFSLCSDVRKSSMALFMAELVYRTVKESEENRELYRFLKESIVQLDSAKDSFADRHLYFTVALCKYLGYAITPDHTAGSGTEVFDREEAQLLQKIVSCPPDAYRPLPYTGSQRHSFLKSMMKYYEYHMGKLPQIRSLDILHQVFL